MVRTMSKIALVGLSLLVLALYAPQAKATPTDFTCQSGCGTVTQNGSNYSSAGVNLLVNGGTFNLPIGDGDEGAEFFSVAFNTSTNAFVITDSSDGDASLTGTITGFSQTGGRLDLDVLFTSPSGFASFGNVHLDLANGTSCGTGCTNFDAYSVDIPV